MNASQIIRVLGGAASVARALGLPGDDVGAKRVRAWALRNCIPLVYAPDLVRIAKAQGGEASRKITRTRLEGLKRARAAKAARTP